MGMCHDRLQNRKYYAFNSNALKRPCLAAARLKKWHAGGLLCRDNSTNLLSVCANVRGNLSASDEESTACEKSWALPRCMLRVKDPYSSWRSDR